MKCPLCEKEIPGAACLQCGAVNPEGANYCMECGVFLGEDTEDILDDDTEDILDDDNGFDLDSRVLCSDGTCTGIIVDGKCTECGIKFKED